MVGSGETTPDGLSIAFDKWFATAGRLWFASGKARRYLRDWSTGKSHPLVRPMREVAGVMDARRGLPMIAVLLLLAVSDAAAQALFRREDDARRTCPGDEVVWISHPYHIYHRRGTPSFGKGPGDYACLRDAARSGARPDRLRDPYAPGTLPTPR